MKSRVKGDGQGASNEVSGAKKKVYIKRLKLGNKITETKITRKENSKTKMIEQKITKTTKLTRKQK